MESIVHFDVAAVIMLIIIFFSTLSSKMRKTTTNRIFLLLIFITLLAAIFNVINTGLHNIGSTNDALLYATRTLYIYFHNLASPVFVTYLISLTRTWHNIIRHPVYSVLVALPHVAEVILLAVNPVFDIYFSYDNGVWIRHKTIFILYICAAIYLFFGIGYVFKHRHLFKISELWIISSAIPLMAVAIILRYFFPNSLIEIFSNAVNLMIISMTIQNPEKSVDDVTGLRNYNAYAEDIKKDFDNKKKQCIILTNITNFNSLRKLLGYDSTNELLRRISNKLNELSKAHKAHAEIYYLDRGRFRIVVNGFNITKAEGLALDINKAAYNTVVIDRMEISPETVVCYARCPDDLKDFKALMAFGNDFHERVIPNGELFYAEELFKQRDFQIMNEMENILERALINKSFQVYYQPIYSIEKKKFVSAEALLRLIDDEFGFVPPNLFIPAAERSGAIHRIGDIVLENVCRFIASDKFRRLGLDYIEINLSVVQCMQKGLADNILSTIEKFGVLPSQINLEITETAASYNQAVLMDNMTKLINAGISFSLDDFGTGYSNMARVASLPLEIIKLDKTFVDNSNKPKLHVFLKGTIKMLKDMDLKIVVEGIETEQMVTMFSELNCDFIQGYFYSKPIPEKDFVLFIEESLKSA